MLVGTAVLPRTGRDWTRWAHAGMLLLLLTGLAMFLADTSRYLHNPAFRIKMALMVAALAWHSTLRRRGRFGAIMGVLLWTAVAIAGRAIADFDIAPQAGGAWRGLPSRQGRHFWRRCEQPESVARVNQCRDESRHGRQDCLRHGG